jgi:polysaccharide biosynthesis transport protein
MATELKQEAGRSLLVQFRRYAQMLLKWKWTAGLFCFIVVAAVTVYSFVVPPIYKAVGVLWIEDEPNILPFEEVQSMGGDNLLQSHAQLLQSRTLAAEVIEKLKLYENPLIVGRLKKRGLADDPSNPVFREKLVQDFLKNISVSSVERTQLVNVQFSSRSPQLAAEILNAIFDDYIDLIVRKRYSASEKASEFLNGQITELRSEIEERERKLNEYGSQKDILPLSAAEAPAVTRIADISRALTEATLDRVSKLNSYNQLKAAPLGEIPEAPEGSLIRRLREQYVTIKGQYANKLGTVKPEYPEMQRLKSELDAAADALENETQNLIRNAYNDYQAALRNEQSLQKLLEDLKNETYKANSNSVVYNSLRIELENRKSLLESLAKRQSETDVSSRLKGLEALNVWIVDKAGIPLKPAFPQKRKNIILGLLLGLAGGAGLAFGIEYLNNTVKTSNDVMAAIGLPTLGTIPVFEAESKPQGLKGELARLNTLVFEKGDRKPKPFRRGRTRSATWLSDAGSAPAEQTQGEVNLLSRIELIAKREPQSIQAESYRSIRTTLFVSSPPGRIKSLLITSPLAREGKSSTVSNLAITLSEAGRKVVIVDSDLRKPKQSRIFGIRGNRSSPGLSRYLSSSIEPQEAIIPTDVPSLSLVTSGPIPATPIELLTSERMDTFVAYLKKNFDFVLFDTPPLLAVSDALAMGPMADAIILIARAGQTPLPAIKQAKQRLDAHKLKCLGVILNGVDLVEQDGYYARQYYHYSSPE